MRAIEKTTQKFIASVRAALPDATVRLQRSVTTFGRSNYVYIDHPRHRGVLDIKVRISDHQVGMRRAKFGGENLFLHARATPDRWTCWLATLVRCLQPSDPVA